jgi:hypothetical protein
MVGVDIATVKELLGYKTRTTALGYAYLERGKGTGD